MGYRIESFYYSENVFSYSGLIPNDYAIMKPNRLVGLDDKQTYAYVHLHDRALQSTGDASDT